MKLLRQQLDKQAHLFEKGGKLEKLHPLWEANDTVLFTPGLVTKAASHVRDALDQKRMMISVVVALFPCFLMAIFNTGYQANAAIAASLSRGSHCSIMWYLWILPPMTAVMNGVHVWLQIFAKTGSVSQ